jgi:hypothetical protein
MVALAGCVALSFAQEAKHVPLMGTITLQGGKTLQGDLLLVAFGVTEAGRFGSDRREVDEGGKLEVDVNGETKTIPGRDIASVEAEWKLAPRTPQSEPEWHITTLTVATRDGQTVTGKPSWFMAMTEFIVDPGDDAEKVHVENYPLFRTSFEPDNLIVKVDLTGEAPTEVEGPTPPGPGMPDVPPIPRPTVIGPGEETPDEETPDEETPDEETPDEETPDEEGPAVTPVATPSVGPPGASKAVSLTLTITCPHCGKDIVVTIDAHAP